MEIHGLVTFLICTLLPEARASAFDLHSALCFLLNMLDICSTVTYHLSSKVKARYRFQINRDAFFGPFALLSVS